MIVILCSLLKEIVIVLFVGKVIYSINHIYNPKVMLIMLIRISHFDKFKNL